MQEAQRARGVTWDKQSKKWKVRFGQSYIKSFKDVNEANAFALEFRQKMGVREHGESAKKKLISAGKLQEMVAERDAIIAELMTEIRALRAAKPADA